MKSTPWPYITHKKDHWWVKLCKRFLRWNLRRELAKQQKGGGEPMSTVEEPTPEEIVVPEESEDVEETGDEPAPVPEETPQDQ